MIYDNPSLRKGLHQIYGLPYIAIQTLKEAKPHSRNTYYPSGPLSWASELFLG